MLQVLCACQTPHLIRLDLEYRVDGVEKDLFQRIVQSFPLLETLEAHRHRSEDTSELSLVCAFVSPARVANAYYALSDLV